jgi:FKBP-type peptidyl-prolyl cis-trans isomerase 2
MRFSTFFVAAQLSCLCFFYNVLKATAFAPTKVPFTVLQKAQSYIYIHHRSAAVNHRVSSRLFMAASDSHDAHQTVTIRSPTKGSVVTIKCCLRPEGDFVPEPLIDGICVDQFDKPKTLAFVLGEGNLLPGLHELISTMKVGDSTEVTLDAGWGDRNPNLEAYVNFADMNQPGFDKSQIKEGVQLLLANGMKAYVTEVSDEKFKIDANPPLAGASYHASVKFLKVEEGPEETVFPGRQTSSRYEVATVACGMMIF